MAAVPSGQLYGRLAAIDARGSVATREAPVLARACPASDAAVTPKAGLSWRSAKLTARPPGHRVRSCRHAGPSLRLRLSLRNTVRRGALSGRVWDLWIHRRS